MRPIFLTLLLFLTSAVALGQEKVEIQAPFSAIDVRGRVAVEIYPLTEGDTVSHATLELEGIQLKEVKWNVKKGCLNLDAERGLLEKKGRAKLTIYVSDLNKIFTKGAQIASFSTITSEDLIIETLGGLNQVRLNIEVRNLIVKCTGQSDILLSGRAYGATLQSNIASRIDMLHCVTNNAYCRVGESSEIYIFVIELLDAKVTTLGTLYYMGKPTLKLKSSLWGEVVPLDVQSDANQDVQ